MLTPRKIKLLFNLAFGGSTASESQAANYPGHLESLIDELRTRERVLCYPRDSFRAMHLGFEVLPVQIPKQQHDPDAAAHNEDFYVQVWLDDQEKCWARLIIHSLNFQQNGSVANPMAVESFTDSVIAAQQKYVKRALQKYERARKNVRALSNSLQTRIADTQHCFRIGQNVESTGLSIRIDGRKSAYHLVFRNGSVDSIQDEVPLLLESLEIFADLGLKFSSDNSRWTKQQGEWISPK